LKIKPGSFFCYPANLSGDGGSRTPDLLNAIQTFSQLNYIPDIFSSNRVKFQRTFAVTLKPLFEISSGEDSPAGTTELKNMP
jgi:hypothetical protein